MPEPKKSNKKSKEKNPEELESIEELIERRKTVAEAYRKILNSLESKVKKQ